MVLPIKVTKIIDHDNLSYEMGTKTWLILLLAVHFSLLTKRTRLLKRTERELIVGTKYSNNLLIICQSKDYSMRITHIYIGDIERWQNTETQAVVEGVYHHAS
jgi:hypothetical protein